MANHGKYIDRNPNFMSAGICNPAAHLGLLELLDTPNSDGSSTTYENDFYGKFSEKTEMSIAGLNKHKTEIKGTMQGPYSYLDETRAGHLRRKSLLGRNQNTELPDDWDLEKPFGIKIKRGYTTAETLEAQSKISNELRSQPKLGKPCHRINVDPNTTFGIQTTSDPRGILMWELFSGEPYGQDEDEI